MCGHWLWEGIPLESVLRNVGSMDWSWLGGGHPQSQTAAIRQVRGRQMDPLWLMQEAGRSVQTTSVVRLSGELKGRDRKEPKSIKDFKTGPLHWARTVALLAGRENKRMIWKWGQQFRLPQMSPKGPHIKGLVASLWHPWAMMESLRAGWGLKEWATSLEAWPWRGYRDSQLLSLSPHHHLSAS